MTRKLGPTWKRAWCPTCKKMCWFELVPAAGQYIDDDWCCTDCGYALL